MHRALGRRARQPLIGGGCAESRPPLGSQGRAGPMVDPDREREGLAWQVGVWNRISEMYLGEIGQWFAPVVDAVIMRARLAAGENVLDLGTGTGAVAERAAVGVRPNGKVVGVDISTDMLALARRRLVAQGCDNVELLEG